MTMETGAKPVKTWDFHPARDRRAESLWVLAGLGLFAGTVVLAAGPVIAGGLGVYGALLCARDWLYGDRKGARARAALEKRGSWRPVEKGYLARAFHDMARAYGVADETRFYIADRAFAETQNKEKMSLVWRVVRAVLRASMPAFPPVKSAKPEDERYFGIKGSFLAYTGMNAVLTTDGEMRKYNMGVKKLILAHELSHLKTRDGYRLERYVRPFVREIRGVFLLGLLVPPLAYAPWLFTGPLAGVLSPLSLMALCAGAGVAGAICMNAASRICERRADRNAMYMTRDLQAAEDKIRVFSGKNFDKKPWLIDTWASTHPLAADRLDNLRAAFAEASAYPPPPHRYAFSDAPSKFARGHKPGVVPWGQPLPPPP